MIETKNMSSDETIALTGNPHHIMFHGDSLEVLRTLPDNSVDAIVTDPPCGISFMNKKWDSDKGGRDAWIAWLAVIMSECLRVTKPGGHAFVWALPRTSHWTATALENAGWEIREVITHLFGQGFPKSLDISKAIDKIQGAEREVISSYQRQGRSGGILGKHTEITREVTASSTPQAQQWDGYGTALKPSSEHWILCRKPLSERTIAANVLRWGTGGLNIDASRINPGETVPGGGSSWGASSGTHEGWKRPAHEHYEPTPSHTQGRWPANTVFTHSSSCIRHGTKRVRGNGLNTPITSQRDDEKMLQSLTRHGDVNYTDSDGMEEVESWECAPDCPVSHLDRQTQGTRAEKASASGLGGWRNQYVGGNTPAYYRGASYTDSGSASRYFHCFSPDTLEAPFLYSAKASRKERNAGCEGLAENASHRYGVMHGTPEHATKHDTPEKNNHPTVKPLSLMRHLVRLITPPDGIVLDPFAGSGSTGVTCVHEGVSFIGIEREEDYVAIAQARIAHAEQQHQQSEAA